MVRYLPLRITRNRSLFPKKEGILKYFSPHVLLGKRQVDYKKEYEFGYGEYVQASVDLEPKTSQLPRSIDAIYLRPLDSKKGGSSGHGPLGRKDVKEGSLQEMQNDEVGYRYGERDGVSPRLQKS